MLTVQLSRKKLKSFRLTGAIIAYEPEQLIPENLADSSFRPSSDHP